MSNAAAQASPKPKVEANGKDSKPQTDKVPRTNITFRPRISYIVPVTQITSYIGWTASNVQRS